ncbi:hypothetical protein BDV96DRAFT_143623 [Lophiotrema nucula]|uniref:Uncharacterized protein n=1 Tax=Lophiotrema nucula TaxID=690887 RepID=A0A6A5ZU91_9PLEO|nr:hypothetical protein BDV96DRAFT_143623 [Lophiotrema nucula]
MLKRAQRPITNQSRGVLKEHNRSQPTGPHGRLPHATTETVLEQNSLCFCAPIVKEAQKGRRAVSRLPPFTPEVTRNVEVLNAVLKWCKADMILARRAKQNWERECARVPIRKYERRCRRQGCGREQDREDPRARARCEDPGSCRRSCSGRTHTRMALHTCGRVSVVHGQHHQILRGRLPSETQEAWRVQRVAPGSFCAEAS